MHRRTLPTLILIPLLVFLTGKSLAWLPGELSVADPTPSLLLEADHAPESAPVVVPTPIPVPLEEPVDCTFFLPDDDTYQSILLSFHAGLDCIEALAVEAEDIYLAIPAGEQAHFVDVGYGSYYSGTNASVELDFDEVAEILAANKDTAMEEVFLIHNHPRFEHLLHAPPTFPDLTVLSNLKLFLAESGFTLAMTGLVVHQGGGLWHYDTLPSFEERVMDPLRRSLSYQDTYPGGNRAYGIYLNNLYGWSKIWKDYPDDPQRISTEMRSRGARMDYYAAVEEFLAGRLKDSGD